MQLPGRCRHVAQGPLAGVPIAGCLGDQMAAMLGQRCRVNHAKNTYGTGCFVLLNTGAEPVASRHGLLTTMAFQPGPDAAPQYALEGQQPSCTLMQCELCHGLMIRVTCANGLRRRSLAVQGHIFG